MCQNKGVASRLVINHLIEHSPLVTYRPITITHRRRADGRTDVFVRDERAHQVNGVYSHYAAHVNGRLGPAAAIMESQMSAGANWLILVPILSSLIAPAAALKSFSRTHSRRPQRTQVRL
jgi:hypothetical protein